MCSCSPPEIALHSQTIEPPVSFTRMSVHEMGAEEARRHKWILSEKAGRDLGEVAIRNWVRDHWNSFLRYRCLEHLQGLKFWIELDHDDFGMLQPLLSESALVARIVEHLKAGQENLGILCWAIDAKLPMPEVLKTLEVLDINSRRIECLVEVRLCQPN